jgi:ribosomal protein S18 acetylase RimI-like enzyme
MFPKATWPLTVEQLSQAISQRFDSMVLLAGSDAVGFANFYKCEPGVSCSIGNVIVSPLVRGKGAGRYLVETMVAIAFDKYHVQAVEISSFNQNTVSLLLYVKLGFLPCSIEERIDPEGNRAALIHMRLERKGSPDHD